MSRLGLAAVLLVLITACGGPGEGEEAVPTPAPPPVDPRLIVHAQGSLALDVQPGAGQEIDPLALAEEHDIEELPCAGYVFLFSWQVDNQAGVSFSGTRQGGSFDIVSGRAGSASISGCVLIRVMSENGRATGELRYIIAEDGLR